MLSLRLHVRFTAAALKPVQFVLLTALLAVHGGCEVPPPEEPKGPVISTVVGNGLSGDNGDGQPPAETALYLVQDVTVGPDGNLYFPDWNNHKIRRVVDGSVETIAGTGELGDAQDGYGPDLQFNHPTNIEFDADGNLIIAAWHNSLVKRLDLTTLQAVTIAGTGARSFSGDDGPATQAALDLPSSVVYEPSTGNILISDQANYRIRLVEPNGTIHTICGDGTPAYFGDGGQAEQARLNSPKGQSAPPAGRITLNADGEIIIADTGNHAVRLIDAAGIITTIAGNGTPGYSGDGGPANAAQLNTPSDVAVGPDGSIYIADTFNHAVRVITPDGIINTLAGTGVRGFSGDGGPASEATLDRPYGLTVATDGTVYVADTHNHRIRRISATLPPDYEPPTDDFDDVEVVPCTGAAGSICTIAGTGQKGRNGDGKTAEQTVMYWPIDVEYAENGRVIVLDWNNHQVREILPNGTFTTIMGTDFVGDGPKDLSDRNPDGADPLTVDLNHPTDLQFLPNGDILIVAWHNHKLRVIDQADGRVHVLAGAGAGFAGDSGRAYDALVNQPRSGVLTPNGDLFVVDQRNQRIRVFYNFAQDREEARVATIVGFDAVPETPGTEPGYNGDGPGLQTRLSFKTGGNPEPSGGITYDPNTGHLYVSDSQNSIIRRIELLGEGYLESVVTTIAGTPQQAGYEGDGGPALSAKLRNPQDLEIGPDGHLYFADTDNNAVRRIDLTTGMIEAVAGTGVKGYSGDGGPAAAALLTRPFGVAFDLDGNLVISDTFNSRLRRVYLGD